MRYFVYLNTKSKTYFRTICNDIGATPLGCRKLEGKFTAEEIPGITQGYSRAQCLAVFLDPSRGAE